MMEKPDEIVTSSGQKPNSPKRQKVSKILTSMPYSKLFP
jgi:hypothetical protein